jgi:hypothetical protein
MTWLRSGAVCGVIAVLAYTSLLLVPYPLPVTVAVAGVFGMCLGVGSVGLYHLLSLHRRTVRAAVAATANVIGGALVVSMIIVQLSIRTRVIELRGEITGEAAGQALDLALGVVNQVQLGLDVAWDLYIGLGTVLFGLAMLGHPRYGRAFGGIGVLIGVGLLILNLATFPSPPGESGLIDLGPLVGLWYLAVSIQVFRSFGWARERLEPRPDEFPTE